MKTASPIATDPPEPDEQRTNSASSLRVPRLILLRAAARRGTHTVTCDLCGRSELCRREDDDPWLTAAEARGKARSLVFGKCPNPGVMHLTTPQPVGVDLLFNHRGELRPLFTSMAFQVSSLAGPVSLSLEIFVVPKDDSEGAMLNAGQFATRLVMKGYRNAKLLEA